MPNWAIWQTELALLIQYVIQQQDIPDANTPIAVNVSRRAVLYACPLREKASQIIEIILIYYSITIDIALRRTKLGNTPRETRGVSAHGMTLLLLSTVAVDDITKAGRMPRELEHSAQNQLPAEYTSSEAVEPKL